MAIKAIRSGIGIRYFLGSGLEGYSKSKREREFGGQEGEGKCED